MKPIWAVARSLIIEVLRMRLLMVFIILLLVSLTIGFALWLHVHPGQANREVQTFLSYSFSFTWTVLSLLTIFLSIATITRDIKRCEVFTVMTKPISRGGFLFGKFLGLAVFNLIAVIIVGIAIYGCARVLQRTEPTSPAERAKLRHLVFVARRAVKAPLPDVSEKVRQMVEAKVASEFAKHPGYLEHPALVDEMRRVLTDGFTKQLILKSQTIPFGHSKTWHFTGIKPIADPDGILYIRFQQDASVIKQGVVISNEWIYGPEDPALAGGTPLYTQNALDVLHEFPIPVSALSPQGDLYLTYRNSQDNNYATIIFPSQENRLALLYTVGGFEANFLRGLALMYVRLILLGVLGLAAGAWLSFPVAVLAVLVLYFIGLSTSFILSSVSWDTAEAHASVVRTLTSLLPNYSAYDPVPSIERGRIIDITTDILHNTILWKDLALTLGVAFVGYLVFRFRELARVII